MRGWGHQGFPRQEPQVQGALWLRPPSLSCSHGTLLCSGNQESIRSARSMSSRRGRPPTWLHLPVSCGRGAGADGCGHLRVLSQDPWRIGGPQTSLRSLFLVLTTEAAGQLQLRLQELAGGLPLGGAQQPVRPWPCCPVPSSPAASLSCPPDPARSSCCPQEGVPGRPLPPRCGPASPRAPAPGNSGHLPQPGEEAALPDHQVGNHNGGCRGWRRPGLGAPS